MTADGTWRVTVLAEEADAAYDRVGLTGYTEHWDRARLALPGNDYAGDDRVELHLGVTRVTAIDRAAKYRARPADGRTLAYDALVLATGSYAFVPPVPGHDLPHATSTAPSTTSTPSGPARWPPVADEDAGRRGDRRRPARPGGRKCVARPSG